jgi:hypothetical protein
VAVPERPTQTVVIVTALDIETRAVLRLLGEAYRFDPTGLS